jgi:F-type H+-transporting ATPase subunit a
MIESPLTIKTVVTLGPVPITVPVVVTWALMAALALGSWIVTRSQTCAIAAPSRA